MHLTISKQKQKRLVLIVLAHLFAFARDTFEKTQFQLQTQIDDPQVADELKLSAQLCIEQQTATDRILKVTPEWVGNFFEQ